MGFFHRQDPTPMSFRRRGPWLRSWLERLDDLEASDLFADLEPDLAR